MGKFVSKNNIKSIIGRLKGIFQPIGDYLTKEEAEENYVNIEVLSGSLNSFKEHTDLAFDNVDEKIDNLSSQKEDKFTLGKGLEMTEDRVLNVTLDTEVFKVVESLPTQPAEGDEKKIHLTLNSEGTEDNIYNEYLWIDDKWEKVGEYVAKIDLTPYITKEEIESTYAKQDGSYPNLIAGNAKNLEGNIEITNDRAARTTGGDNDVNSGYEAASIQSIRGNAIAWNQLINGDNTSYKADTWQYWKAAYTLVVGHKYYMNVIYTTDSSFIKTNNVLGLSHTGMFFGGTVNKEISPNETNVKWKAVVTSAPKSLGDNENTGMFYASFNPSGDPIYLADNQKHITFKNVMLIDLSLIYGLGNEPTAEQFEADYLKWFGRPLEYEAFDAGSLRSVKATGIKTVGFNLSSIDKFEGTVSNWAYPDGMSKGLTRILFTNTYGYEGRICITTKGICTNNNTLFVITYTDGTNSYSTDVEANTVFNIKSLTSPGKIVKNIKAVINKDEGNTLKIFNLCINFEWSGKRNGDYEPHWESIAKLPITELTSNGVKIFPDGLKRAGNVYDEIVVEGGVTKAIKRVGSVDLGSLSWGAEGGGYTRYVANLSINAGAWTSSFGLCGKYLYTLNLASFPSSTTDDMTILVNHNTVYVRNLSVENVSNLKQSLQGVILYYTLETPQEYIIDNFDLPLAYRIDDFGTEEIVQPTTSIAPILITKYGINAVDSIRRLPEKFDEIKENYWSKSNLEIGGRNLLKYTGSNISNVTPSATKGLIVKSNYITVGGNNSSTAVIYPRVFIKVDKSVFSKKEKFILSFEIKTSDNTQRIASIANGGSSPYVMSNYTVNTTTEWQKKVITFTNLVLGDEVQDDIYVQFWINPKASTTQAYDGITEIRNVKLERGTVATDWTPAPEDGEWIGTQTQYDALGTYDNSVTYYITE